MTVLAELTSPTGGAWAGIAAIVAMFVLPRLLANSDQPPRPYPRVRWQRQPEGRLRGGVSVSRPALDGRPPERMPAPRTGLSPDYRRYIDSGLEPLEPENRARWDGVTWPERMRLFLSVHKRQAGGWCESGRKCGGKAQAIQGHHLNYSELFHETRRTVKLVCRGCHVEEEKAKQRRAG
jgi:hypothetical protein